MKLISFLDVVDDPYFEQQVRVVNYSILPNNSFFELALTFLISSIILFVILGIALFIMKGNENSNKYLQIFKLFKLFVSMVIVSFIIVLIYFLGE